MCWIYAESFFDDTYVHQWESSGIDGDRAQLAGTRVFSVKADQQYTFGCFTAHRSDAPGLPSMPV